MKNNNNVKLIWSSWNTEINENFRYIAGVETIEKQIRFIIATNKKHGIDYLRIKNF